MTIADSFQKAANAMAGGATIVEDPSQHPYLQVMAEALNELVSIGTAALPFGHIFINSSPVAITLMGSPTNVQQIQLGDGSVYGVVGTRYSSGGVLLAANAFQPTSGVDSWTQSLGSQASVMIELTSGENILFKGAPSGRATGTDAAFWTLLAQMTSTALTPGTTGAIKLGDTTLGWSNIYIEGGDLTGRWHFTTASSALNFVRTGVAVEMVLSTTALTSAVAGGLTLGTAALPWGDLWFASGAVVGHVYAATDVNIGSSSANNVVILRGGSGVAKFTLTDFSPILVGGLTLGTAALPWGGITFAGVGGGSIGPGKGELAGGNAVSPISARLAFGTDNTGWMLRFAKNASGVVTDLWSIVDSGHLLTVGDNAFDIGASGATRPRTGYFGTSVVIGTAPVGGVALAVGGVIVPLDNSGVQWYSAGGVRRFGLQGTATDRAEFFTGSGGITKLMFVLADVGKLIPGATSFSLRNNADSADNVLIADNGDVTIRGKLTVTGGVTAVAKVLFMDGNLSNSSGGDASLTSYSLPGGTLGTDKQELRITVTYQQLAAAATAFNIKFGATQVCGIAPAQNVTGTITIHIIRTGATTQISHAMCVGSSLVIGDDTDVRTTPAETLSGAVLIDFRANPGAGNTLFNSVLVELLST